MIKEIDFGPIIIELDDLREYLKACIDFGTTKLIEVDLCVGDEENE